ncbi:MAG: hypothetical protein ACM3XM_20525 [Mycobacterium leprae]
MRGALAKTNLADRTEGILRKDRRALQAPHLQSPKHAALLSLLPANDEAVDLMDEYIQAVADAAGLQYIRPSRSGLEQLPVQYILRARLVLADLTGRDEQILSLVYKALSLGRPVLLTAQSAADVPADLSHIAFAPYSLDEDQFMDFLLQAERHAVARRNCTAD